MEDNQIMNLYAVTTKGLGSYFVVAIDPTRAQEGLKEVFNKQETGTSGDREVLEIKWLAEMLPQRDYPGKKRLITGRPMGLLMCDCN